MAKLNGVPEWEDWIEGIKNKITNGFTGFNAMLQIIANRLQFLKDNQDKLNNLITKQQITFDVLQKDQYINFPYPAGVSLLTHDIISIDDFGSSSSIGVYKYNLDATGTNIIAHEITVIDGALSCIVKFIKKDYVVI